MIYLKMWINQIISLPAAITGVVKKWRWRGGERWEGRLGWICDGENLGEFGRRETGGVSRFPEEFWTDLIEIWTSFEQIWPSSEQIWTSSEQIRRNFEQIWTSIEQIWTKFDKRLTIQQLKIPANLSNLPLPF
jgi:hypothetical protein